MANPKHRAEDKPENKTSDALWKEAADRTTEAQKNMHRVAGGETTTTKGKHSK
jgi:hypothetical protein